MSTVFAIDSNDRVTDAVHDARILVGSDPEGERLWASSALGFVGGANAGRVSMPRVCGVGSWLLHGEDVGVVDDAVDHRGGDELVSERCPSY